MPEWLLKRDDYAVKNGKDTFIDKSIMSILKILTDFRLHTCSVNNIIKINALLKVITAILIILLAALSRSLIYILLTDGVLLLIISSFAAGEIKHIISVSFKAVFVAFFILLPSIILGNINNSLLIVLKVLSAVLCVNILSYSSKWNDITGAFKIFCIPDIFIFVFDITMKYIMILGEFAINMLYALKKRSVGKSKNKNSSLSGIIGTMFIKSKEMAEDMYGAMECRGFTGNYSANKKIKFHFEDYLCIIIDVAIVFVYIYFDRL